MLQGRPHATGALSSPPACSKGAVRGQRQPKPCQGGRPACQAKAGGPPAPRAACGLSGGKNRALALALTLALTLTLTLTLKSLTLTLTRTLTRTLPLARSRSPPPLRASQASPNPNLNPSPNPKPTLTFNTVVPLMDSEIMGRPEVA